VAGSAGHHPDRALKAGHALTFQPDHPMGAGHYGHFREDLERTLADPERMAGFTQDRIGPLDDAVGELELSSGQLGAL